MKKAERPRGRLKTSEESLKVIPFFQDAPYYTRKGTYYNSKNKLSKALLFLQKAIEIEPGDPWNHYNLACLLSKTSRLREANQVFKHIVQNMDGELTECYFFMAVNHGLMEELTEAKSYLSEYLHASPEGEMAEEAEELLLIMEEDEEEMESGDRSLPAAENEAILQLINDMSLVKFKERLLEEEEFRRVLQKGLFQGSDLLKEKVLGLCGEAGGAEARKNLADFAANPWVKERLRQVALLELKKTALAGGTCRVFSSGGVFEVDLQSHPLPAPVWESKWQEVLECTLANMRRSAYYSEEFFEDARAIWLDFINHSYPQGPRVDRLQTWAAGLEYCLVRFHFLGLTQKELAAVYGVSAASIRRKFSAINGLLQIDQKAYRSMLTILAGGEEEQF